MISLRAIRLRSITSSNQFGADISLTDGLNIIQADNTSGKSTCLQSILYCLGLERSLGPSLDVPLPLAMRERIEHKKDGPLEQVEHVIQSYAMLELENSSNEIITIRRDITGGTDRKLVRVQFGPLLSSAGGEFEQKDYFLFDAGSATRDQGFHTFLSQYIGWELPIVPRYDGDECHLYLETLFPMFFVEQKKGWSTIQGPFPTFFGIQDMSRRVMEFLLDLDVGKTRRQKSELRKIIRQIELRWGSERRSLMSSVGGLVRVAGLPIKPNAEFSINCDLNLALFHESEWQSIEIVSEKLRKEITLLDKVELVSVSDASKTLQAKLNDFQEKHDSISTNITFVRNEFNLNQSEHNSVSQQIELLEIDLKRNIDAKKLQDLGSVLGTAATENACPTCHQGVSRELLPETTKQGMAIDENIAFIRSQLDLYRSIKDTTEKSLQNTRVRYNSFYEELKSVRQNIRSIKRDLTRPEANKHRSTIEEIVRLQAKLDRWKSLQEQIDSKADGLKSLAQEWTEATMNLRGLGTGALTSNDKGKRDYYQKRMQKLLDLFGFTSFKPEEIILSDDNFRPQVFTTNEKGESVEKDIGFEASASDGIRLKWAYYLGLLDLSNKYEINNIGFSIFDEPGQQQMKDVDLVSFLAWTAENVSTNRQVIVTTSESLDKVKSSVASGRANIQPFEGYILQAQ